MRIDGSSALAVRGSIRRLLYVRCRKAFKLLGIGSEAVKVLCFEVVGIVTTLV